MRRVYYFGYGADREVDMLRAITGHTPKLLGEAVLPGYSLHVQSLKDITTRHANPQRILEENWGKKFKSYVVVPQKNAKVIGNLYQMSLHDRHLIDDWELVDEGWYCKEFVRVQLRSSGKLYRVETQVLAAPQKPGQVVNGAVYKSWLQPKKLFVSLAKSLRMTSEKANRA